MKPRLITIAIILAQAGVAQNAAPIAPSQPAQLSAFFDAAIKRRLFRGAVVVVDRGEVIFERACGDAEAGVRKTTLDSAFYLASISKQFTATAIMLLTEQDRLSYDHRLSTYFPAFPKWAQTITLRHLLTHTSGLGNYLADGIPLAGLTNATVVAHLSKLERLTFQTGARYGYSNSGYLLLARVVERVAKTSFRSFASTRIFKPLGMTSAVFYDETQPTVPNRVFGYDRFGRRRDSPMLTNGAGGMYASARDLVRWYRSIFAAKLLQRETLDGAFRATRLNDGTASPYGFGWHVHERKHGKVLHHTGSLAGFRHFVFADLVHQQVVIMLTNGGDAFPLGAMATAIDNILRGRPATLPKPALIDHLFAFAKTSPTGLRQEANRVRTGEPNRFRTSEEALNELGYAFLAMARIPEATDVLHAAIDAYPESSNAYDSYAEALMRGQSYDAAVVNYRKSLELDPTNENATRMLQRLARLIRR